MYVCMCVCVRVYVCVCVCVCTVNIILMCTSNGLTLYSTINTVYYVYVNSLRVSLSGVVEISTSL